MENKTEKIYWTASNNSSFLNGCREAKNMLCAVRAARRYVDFELYGEGSISYYNNPDDLGENPIRTDTKDIFTGHRWVIKGV